MYGKTRQPVAFRPILLIATIIYVSITTLFWTRIGWFFEDAWHWLKRRRTILDADADPRNLDKLARLLERLK